MKFAISKRWFKTWPNFSQNAVHFMLRLACYVSLCCSSSYWDDVGIVVLNQCNQPIFSTIMKNADILYSFVILSKTFIDALKYCIINFFHTIFYSFLLCLKLWCTFQIFDSKFKISVQKTSFLSRSLNAKIR